MIRVPGTLLANMGVEFRTASTVAVVLAITLGEVIAVD